jgi:hypothetical protein
MYPRIGRDALGRFGREDLIWVFTAAETEQRAYRNLLEEETGRNARVLRKALQYVTEKMQFIQDDLIERYEYDIVGELNRAMEVEVQQVQAAQEEELEEEPDVANDEVH